MNADDPEAITLSKIPLLAGDNKKMEYLQFRAIGFSFVESCDLTGVAQTTVRKWRKNDPQFKSFESTQLEELQRTIGPEIMRLKFMRTMALFMDKDLNLAAQAHADIEQLTDREYDWLKNSRKYYSPESLLSLDKAVSPEKHKETQVVVLEWGSRGTEMNIIDSPEVKELDTG